MTWFYLCLGSVTALALAEISQQHLLNTKDPFNPRTSAVLTFLLQALATLPVIFIKLAGHYGYNP